MSAPRPRTGRARGWSLGILAMGLCVGGIGAEEQRTPPPVYKPAYRYPVSDDIRKEREAAQAQRDSLRRIVDERYREEEKRAREEKRELRLDWSGIDKPGSLEEFTPRFHLPPVPQYNTGTCWAFCSVSLFESEVYRLTGRAIKLSEMWVVYWEYVEKARRYIREYGHSEFGEGSQDHGTQEVFRLYGAVPAEAYLGQRSPEGRHDHEDLFRELERFLSWVRENNFWDEEKVIAYVRAALDSHLGPPPSVIIYEGVTYSPLEFLDQVLQIKPDDYVSVVSTLSEPFGQYVLFDVTDNWRRRADFLNLPLDEFYGVIKSALVDGYTVSIGGDVSEPGLDGMEDAAVIPSWDIPSAYIDQGSREYRIDNGTTGDDHGVHVVGYCQRGRDDWFLIKDSNRSSRLGQFKGYYFYHGDYIKLKMLSFMVHKDRLAGKLPG
jgi:bleomycin hydrolase